MKGKLDLFLRGNRGASNPNEALAYGPDGRTSSEPMRVNQIGAQEDGYASSQFGQVTRGDAALLMKEVEVARRFVALFHRRTESLFIVESKRIWGVEESLRTIHGYFDLLSTEAKANCRTCNGNMLQGASVAKCTSTL